MHNVRLYVRQYLSGSEPEELLPCCQEWDVRRNCRNRVSSPSKFSAPPKQVVAGLEGQRPAKNTNDARKLFLKQDPCTMFKMD